MGTKQETKLIVLSVLFLVTLLLVHGRVETTELRDKPPLNGYFQELAGYRPLRDIDLNSDAVQMLDLDDYAFIDYEGEQGKINLYIGYYATANKAYASHSPMVCYPSQGWRIDKRPERRSLVVGEYTVNHEVITTSYGDHQELVLYWYQTYSRTSTQVYRNKIDMAYSRLRYGDEQHAFVRVSVPFAGSSPEEAERAAAEFIRLFFPKMVDFFAEGQG